MTHSQKIQFKRAMINTLVNGGRLEAFLQEKVDEKTIESFRISYLPGELSFDVFTHSADKAGPEIFEVRVKESW